MAKTNLTTFFENGLLAPFLNTVKNQPTQDRVERLYEELEKIYSDKQLYSTENKSKSDVKLKDLLKYQPKYKEIIQSRKSNRHLRIPDPVARYITSTFPLILAIPENEIDQEYRDTFDYIVDELLKGPPRNSVGRKSQYSTAYGWDESFEEKLPQNFIVNNPQWPPNMIIFAFKRKLVAYTDPKTPNGEKLWKIV